MKCINCGTEFDGNFCPFCGHRALPATPPAPTVAPTFPANQPVTPIYHPPVPTTPPKKKTAIIVTLSIVAALVVIIGGVVAFFLLKDGFDNDNSKNNNDLSSNNVSSSVLSEIVSEPDEDDSEDEDDDDFGMLVPHTHDYVYGECSECGKLNEDAVAVKDYVENNREALTKSLQGGLNATGMHTEASISTKGTGIVIDIRFSTFDNLSSDQKDIIQKTYDSLSSVYAGVLDAIQLEIPEAEYLIYNILEVDGDFIASIEIYD